MGQSGTTEPTLAQTGVLRPGKTREETIALPLLDEERQVKRSVDKIKFPYNLQPMDIYLRQAEQDHSFLQELTTALMVMFC